MDGGGLVGCGIGFKRLKEIGGRRREGFGSGRVMGRRGGGGGGCGREEA